MLLKSLEIYGFKSFAEKTILEFEPGVTAIVGPNGCGKSNIVDAMKWVLGEQSAKELRGGSMEDVIFNGTELADKVNFAEVSLKISNESGKLPIDFSEVTISRRLFRTGDSDYLINMAPVRLKDVQDLIAGTGIGTKAYSLMEQGKMDLIVSSKPDERRYVFEEASGITRFKNKKKEALRKLEHTENNLLRVSDIISEIRRQISSLERQARKAENYKIVYEDIKSKELILAAAKIKAYKGSISSFSSKKNMFNEDSSKMQRLLESKESLAKALRGDISESSEKIAQEENILRDASSRQQRNKERIEWNNQVIEEIKERIDILRQELEDIVVRINLSQSKMTELRGERDSFDQEGEVLDRGIGDKKREVESIAIEESEIKEEIEGVKSKILEYNYEFTQKNNLLLELESELKSLRIRIERLKENRSGIILTLEEQNFKLEKLELELRDKDQELGILKNELDGIFNDKTTIERGRESLTADKVNLEKKSANYEARLDSWLEIYSKGLGYSEGTKAVANRFPDLVLGRVSDIIRVAPEYVDRVELAFGEKLKSIVVNARESAVDILKYCKSEGFSDIEVVVLSELKFKDSEYIEGTFPIAYFIELDADKKAILSLVADVLYVEDSERARELSFNYPVYRFLAQGHLAFQGPTLGIGFDPTKDLGLLDRDGKIGRLKEEIEILKKSLEEVSVRIVESEKKYSQVTDKLSDFEVRKSGLNDHLIGLKKTLESGQANRERLSQEQEVLNLDIEDIEAQLSSDASRRDRLKTELNESGAKIKKDEERLLSLQDSQAKLIDRKHELSIGLAQLETKEASYIERKQKYDDIYKSVEIELQNLNIDKQKRENEQVEIGIKIGQLEDEVSRLRGENEDLKVKLEEGAGRLTQDKSKYEDLKSQFEREEDELIKLRNEYAAYKDEAHSLDLNMNEEEYRIKSIRERLNQVYGITDIPDEVEGEVEIGAVEEELKDLQGKLERMGEVNLVAIEEHKSLKERSIFLENQERDLLEAKESLQAAIRKINKTTRDMFSGTFQQVRASFKEIFPRLFGGGDADLVLEEGIDCLEAGIEILARPPGKKLQGVSLLSGGEKALTALSLLFAIFQSKPSPFCILDEVDAPLDESNIDRYRKMLEEFSRLSQFLVITHNKRTISTADIIYGITMENTGISKIVSVKFHKTEESVASC
ncbi:MAG: chromosome segregation protein SMC [Candidatus Kaelpia aquatica]|nr:chromosome segregation protein SMC [Candidatus Kaelpia aquatica]